MKKDKIGMPELINTLDIDFSKYNNYELYALSDKLEAQLSAIAIQANDKSKYITPTQIGTHINIPARNVNKLLARMGLQMRVDIPDFATFWMPTNEGMLYCDLYRSNQKNLPEKVVQGKVPYAALRDIVYHDDGKWSDYKWVTVSSYIIKWKPSVLQGVLDYVAKHGTTI